VTKTFHFAGTHSVNVGYNWQFPKYAKDSSGPGQIPNSNPERDGRGSGYDTHNPPVAGQMTDSNFDLVLANNVAGLTAGACTLCPYMTVPGFATPQQVVLQQVRGRFDGGVTNSSGKYHAGYINDAWQINKYVTINAGVRWEQQRLVGNQVERTFSNMFSPRAGIIVDRRAIASRVLCQLWPLLLHHSSRCRHSARSAMRRT